jgi:hypothetical protein
MMRLIVPKCQRAMRQQHSGSKTREGICCKRKREGGGFASRHNNGKEFFEDIRSRLINVRIRSYSLAM